MNNNETDYIALRLLSLILILNICCCNPFSCVIGIGALVKVSKACNSDNKNDKDRHTKHCKLLLIIGYGINFVELILMYLIDIVSIIEKLITL